MVRGRDASRSVPTGHTRIPVVDDGDPTRVVALLYAKDLVGIGFERRLSLGRVLEAFDASKRVHEVGGPGGSETCQLAPAFATAFETVMPTPQKSSKTVFKTKFGQVDRTIKLDAAFEHCKRYRIHLLIVVDKTQRSWPMVGIVTVATRAGVEPPRKPRPQSKHFRCPSPVPHFRVAFKMHF